MAQLKYRLQSDIVSGHAALNDLPIEPMAHHECSILLEQTGDDLVSVALARHYHHRSTQSSPFENDCHCQQAEFERTVPGARCRRRVPEQAVRRWSGVRALSNHRAFSRFREQGVAISTANPADIKCTERHGHRPWRNRISGGSLSSCWTEDLMARNDIRPVIKIRSTAGTGYTYVTKKNRRNDPDRIVLRKYDPVVRRHVEFREER